MLPRGILPSVRCSGFSRSTGKPCRNLAIRGGTVCRSHGAQFPAVRDQADVRGTLASALSLGDRRHPWEILFDALHAADTLMRDARLRLAQDESVTPEEISRFVDSFERAARLAKITLDSRAQEYAAYHARIDGEEIAGVIQRALARVQLPEDYDDAMRDAIADELRAMAERERGTPAAIAGRADVANGSRPSGNDPLEGEVVGD